MAFLAFLWGLRFAITSSALLKHPKHPKKRRLFLSWEDRMAAEQPRATEQNEAVIAPNCQHPRFFLKTKGVCTQAADGSVCFQSVKDRHALIKGFQPRLLVGDKVGVAPDGIYCWILRGKWDNPTVYAMKVICKQEIGSLHNFIFLLSSGPGHLLTEGDKFKDAHEVIAAGELLVNGGERLFNLQSGSFMEPILGIKPCLPIVGKRIYKTRDVVVKERGDNITERNKLVDKAAPYLSATFASVPIPDVPASIEGTAVTQYVKSLSEALGGRPFLPDAEIITSENNMGFLRSFMSTDPPVCQRPLHVSMSNNAKQSYAKQAKQSKQANKPYAKKGGTRRTRRTRKGRKTRKSHKSRRACRV